MPANPAPIVDPRQALPRPAVIGLAAVYLAIVASAAWLLVRVCIQ